jgi:hypothetical protein
MENIETHNKCTGMKRIKNTHFHNEAWRTYSYRCSPCARASECLTLHKLVCGSHCGQNAQFLNVIATGPHYIIMGNNGEVEMAVCQSLRMQEPGFYVDRRFKLVSRLKKCIIVLKIMILECSK